MVMVVIIWAVMVTDMVLVMVMVIAIMIVMVLDMLVVMVLGMVIAVVIVVDMMVVMVAVMVLVMIKVLGGFDFGSNHCGGNISGGDGCGAQTLKMSDPSSPLRVALAPRLSGRVALWGRFWRWRCEGRRPPLLSSWIRTAHLSWDATPLLHTPQPFHAPEVGFFRGKMSPLCSS